MIYLTVKSRKFNAAMKTEAKDDKIEEIETDGDK